MLQFTSASVLWLQAVVFILMGILLIIVPELLSWFLAFILIWLGIMLFFAGLWLKKSTKRNVNHIFINW